MDIDFFELDSDRIKQFLISKLEEVETLNNELDESLKKRQEISSDYLQQINKNNIQHEIKVLESWRKVVDAKYVLGFNIETDGVDEEKQNLSVILHWNSSRPLHYKSFVVPLKRENSTYQVYDLNRLSFLSKTSCILVILNMPLFIDQLSYEISALLLWKEKNKMGHSSLPSVTLTLNDAMDKSQIVDISQVIDGSSNELLSHVVARDKYEFCITIPTHFDQRIDSIFEVLCAFYKVNCEATIFVVHKVSPLFDGSVIEVQGPDEANTCPVTIYYSTEQALLSLFHYLLSHLPEISITPSHSYRPEMMSEETEEKLKNSIFSELDFVSHQLGRAISNKEDRIKFKRILAEMECQSDILRSQIEVDLEQKKEESESFFS